jgi:hypothetical protein
MLQPLIALVRSHAPAAGARWLEDAVESCASGCTLEALARAYTAAPRHVGRRRIGADAELERPFRQKDSGFTFAQWTVEDAARAALLLATADGADFFDLALGAYEAGDAREQQSWLRALPLMPDPALFTANAIDACRTNIVPLFESIACENPFPARHFPELNFNQVVLKAMFNGIALERIVSLHARLNRELARMASDYADERRAAGRSVPADIGLVLQT